jgi:hypothetical protein
MRVPWHMLIPGLALVFQIVPPLLLQIIARAAYAGTGNFLQTWERPASLLVMGFAAAVSLLLGSLGAYGLLTRARLGTAVVLIAGCCLPALFGGAVYLHGLLIFLAWV